MSKIKVPTLIIVVAVLAGFALGSVLSGQVHAESSLNGKLHVFNEILRYADKFYVEDVDAEALGLVGEEARRLGEFLEFPSLDIEMAPYHLDEEGTPLVPIGMRS